MGDTLIKGGRFLTQSRISKGDGYFLTLFINTLRISCPVYSFWNEIGVNSALELYEASRLTERDSFIFFADFINV